MISAHYRCRRISGFREILEDFDIGPLSISTIPAGPSRFRQNSTNSNASGKSRHRLTCDVDKTQQNLDAYRHWPALDFDEFRKISANLDIAQPQISTSFDDSRQILKNLVTVHFRFRSIQAAKITVAVVSLAFALFWGEAGYHRTPRFSQFLDYRELSATAGSLASTLLVALAPSW